MTTRKKPPRSPLGIDTSNLGKLKAKDLINNKALASTLLTYLQSVETDKSELETEVETLKTYATNYEIDKFKGKVAAALNILATIFIGIGVNLLTSNQTLFGLLFLIPGALISIFATVILVKKHP